MPKIFFQNHLYNENSDLFIDTIIFLKANLSFQSSLTKFWKLHKKDYDGRISLFSFQEHLYLIYKFMFPYFEKSALEELITEASNSMVSMDNQKEILLDQFIELFACFCVVWIETPCLQATINFLDLVFERTTKIIYRNINNKDLKCSEIDFHMEVIFIEKEECEKFVNVQERKKRDEIVYYQEKLVLNHYLKKQAELDFEIVSERILINEEEIIPLGFSVESILIHLMNENYDVNLINKDGKSLLVSEHFTTKVCASLSQIKLIAHLNEATLSKLKNFLEYHIYLSSAVIDNQNSQKTLQEISFFRLNQITNRKYIFTKLKNKYSPNPQYYNIVSAFYKFEDYEIDLIDKLHKEWNNKSDDHQDLTPFPKFDTLDPEDSQLSPFNIHFLATKIKIDNSNRAQAEEFLQQDKEANFLNIPILPSLNFHNYVSKHDCLPIDNEDPYIEDLLEHSNNSPLQILVVGKPRIGKTTFCADLAKKMDLIHIEIELSIEKLFKKIKDFEENPEMDEENNAKEFLTPLEKDIILELKSGCQISYDSLRELLNVELDDPLVSLKGFILDIPLIDTPEFSWLSQLLNGNLRIPQINCRYFTHMINLEVPDIEVSNFVSNLRENLEDYKLYSEYDRLLLKNPKPKTEEEELQEETEEKKPLKDENLLIRTIDTPEFIDPLLERYSQKTLKKLQSLSSHLTKSQFIEIKASGLPYQQLSEIALAYLAEFREPLRPLPIRLDPGSDGNLKELLSQGLDDGKPARKWSGFYQIDPVELFNGKVVIGKGDFPISYAGRVFLFEKEENLLEFFKNPRKFLKNRPKMPKGYNISICGPHLSGKKTYAELLNKFYGWKIVDVEKIVEDALLEQKNWTAYTPCNPLVNSIHCSEAEWKDIMKGNAIPTRSILPLVFHHLGYPLQKRPPKPPPKEGEEGYEEYMAAEELAAKEIQKEEERNKEKPGSKKGFRPEKAVAIKKEDKPDKKEEEKEAVIEDLPLKDLSPLPDEYGQFQPFTGFLFINFPINEEQIQAMKEFQFNIDKVIFLVDTNEEETEPGKILGSRANFEALHSLENEIAFSDTALKFLQEQLTEEIVKTVSIVGSRDEVFNRIRTTIDPFYVRVDDESNVRLPGELGDGDEPIPYASYGPYCPITLMEEKWLVPGKEDQELQVKGKRYRFYSEKELKIFKSYIEKYTTGTIKCPPPPRLMFFGVRGSGLKTQLKLLNEKYKISIFDLKEEMLYQLNQNKSQRKQARILSRGFKPKEINEEGQEIEDAEINEESQDFDKKVHEISVLTSLLSPLNEIFINGNFFDLEEEQISTPLLEMLQESKRLPEAAIFLKVSDKSFLPRVFDESKIKAEYYRLLDELKKKREDEKRQAKQQIIDSGEEAPQEQEEEPEAPIEEDPEAPKLEEMLSEQRDKFLQRREGDLSKIEEMIEGFTAAGVPVVTIETDRDIQNVFKAIIWELKNFLESRENKLEKHQVINIPEEKIQHYRESYHIKPSRFGLFNALDISYLPVTQENAFIYRERIYFFESEERKKLAASEPLKFLKGPEIPLDINYKPAIFLIGRPKSGVSSLAKVMEQNLGIVRVKISKILEELKDNFSKLSYESLQLLKLGNSPNEEMFVELISQRVQQRDCLEKGWILDSFPQTTAQANLLAKKGIIPNCVFSLQLNDFEIKTRVKEKTKEIRLEFETQRVEFLKKKIEEAEENEELKKNKDSIQDYEFEYKNLKLGYDGFLLHQRLRKSTIEINNLENFYLDNYNNVKFLDGNLSKWGLYERAKNFIQKTIKQRQMLARALVLREPCIVGDLALTQYQIIEFLSEFKNYCPLSFKSKQEMISLSYRNRYLTFYNFKLYNLVSYKHFKDFKKQPYLYLDKNLFKQFQEMPSQITYENLQEKGIKPIQDGYDVVELSNKVFAQGRKNLLVEYKKKFYLFNNVKNLQTFMKTPHLFAEVKLPEKYLGQKQESTNKNKRNNNKDSSSSYLENNLSNIVMKVLANLGYRKIKYPTISPQETSLKFLALSLKANNPNQNEYYRRKYQKKLQDFLEGCELSQNFYQEHKRREENKDKEGEWNEWDEENYLKLAEEIDVYLKNISSKDKTSYFYDYIR